MKSRQLLMKKNEGLSLRFASDQDFMRLVAKGDIQVYAFKAKDVLSLDRSFRFSRVAGTRSRLRAAA